MFKMLTTTKKGFTLVELVIVLLLLGIGAYAIVNLASVAYRSFNKSEERFIKQENVKTLVEFLQTQTNIGAATSATIFNNLSILPEGEEQDNGFSYLFSIPVLEDADGNQTEYEVGMNTAGKKCIGYHLYALAKGAKRSAAVCLNPDVPLYVVIKTYKSSYKDINDVTVYENEAAVDVQIAAVENDAVFEDESAGGLFTPESSDDIYYSLDVTYHFPNMVTNKQGLVVNSSSGEYNADGTRVLDTADGYSGQDINGNYLFSKITASDIGCVLRITADSILSGDNADAAATVSTFCFIATASYGVETGEVGLLCRFRDECLLTNAPGRLFVKAYYTLSPPIAEFISTREPLKAAVRVMLKPLIVVASYATEPALLGQTLPALAAFAMCAVLAAAAVHINKQRRREEKN